MHPVIEKGLEDYVAGTLLPANRREFDAHLESCQECRQEIREMMDISEMFQSLRTEETVAPSPAFTARVMAGIRERRPASLWGMFFDPDFGRRVVFASLVTLAVLGSYLVSRETQYTVGPASPDVIMAEQSAPGQNHTGNDRDMMLVTLTSYEP